MRNYNQFDNYCPFITEYAKCSVYKDRPPICREFGTMPDRQNRCHEKVSRLDIAKYYVKDFLNFYWNIIKSVKNKITNVFKPKKANKNFGDVKGFSFYITIFIYLFKRGAIFLHHHFYILI